MSRRRSQSRPATPRSMRVPLTGFVRCPSGIVMHAENHRQLVEAIASRGLRAMLEPAEPFDANPSPPLDDDAR